MWKIEAIRKEHHFSNMAITDAEIARECQELEDQEIAVCSTKRLYPNTIVFEISLFVSLYIFQFHCREL